MPKKTEKTFLPFIENKARSRELGAAAMGLGKLRAHKKWFGLDHNLILSHTLMMGSWHHHLGHLGSPPCGFPSSRILDKFPYMVVFGDLPRPQNLNLQALRGQRFRIYTLLYPHITDQSKIQRVWKETPFLDGQLYKILGHLFNLPLLVEL